MTAILFPFLKIFDLVKQLFLKKRKTVVTFKHPDEAHLMREIYTRKKENPDTTFYVVAAPEQEKWDEYIRMGKGWLHNQYRLEVSTHRWSGKPNWRTLTASVIASFELDFSAAGTTTLTLTGKKNITDGGSFQSWFSYCRMAGVEEINVEK